MKRDDSNESARAGLLRDFDTAEYNIGSNFGTETYGANDQFDRGFQTEDYFDINTDILETFATSNSQFERPPQGIFDDI